MQKAHWEARQKQGLGMQCQLVPPNSIDTRHELLFPLLVKWRKKAEGGGDVNFLRYLTNHDRY